MRRVPVAVIAMLAVFIGCQDETLLGPDGPGMALQDGSTTGNPHFYFLPPLAPEPDATGDFDAGVAADVVICEWTGAECGATVATFDTEGAGSERVRADGSEGHYIVNWHTRRSSLEPDQVYRITVSAEGVELGSVDVYAVRSGRDLRGVDSAEYFPLLIGRTVPIKFRIEVGAFELPTARVVGTITDVTGGGLAGVHASLEGTAIVGTSNDLGGLTLEGVRAGQSSVLRLSLAGYADQLVQIDIPEDVEQVTFRTSMLQRAAPVTVSATAGGTATSTDGASVVLAPSSLVDGDGNAVTGDVDVTVTPVDVSGDGIEAFPGSFTGVNADGESGLILTYGVAEYTFTQGGQELNLAAGETATIRLPVYSGDAGLSVGDELPLWFLDEETGDWIEEGSGTVIADAASPTGLAVEGQVTHFSWWNIDVWQESPYEPWVRCIVDGAPTDCTIYAEVDDPSFPRSSATAFLPAEGTRLTFPASPVVTEVLGQASNRYGTVPGGVSGPSGGGAGDTVVVDLTEEGIVSGDHSVVTLSTDTVEIPGTVVFTLEARDSTGAPVDTGGAFVRFWVFEGGTARFLFPAEDNGDGTYTYEHTPRAEGTFTVRGEVNATVVATGDPSFTAVYSATAGRGATSLVTASATSVPIGGAATITLEAYDSAGVAKTTGGDSVTFRPGSGALLADGTIGPVTDNGDGTYTATFTGTGAGAPVEILSTINFEPVTTGNPAIAVSPSVLTEAGADSALAEAFLAWWTAAHGFHVEWTMATMADLPSSSWFNADMGVMSAEPRPAWNNDPDYTWASAILFPWLEAYTAVSRAYDVLRSLDAGLLMNGGADNPRTRAAAKLVQGLAHAQLALVFDQAFVLSEDVDVSAAVLSLEPYDVVMDDALAFLQEAITIADANTFTLPSHWIEGAPLTDAELAQVAHSYSARFMAAVARTPAERAAADWASIRTHISQGIATAFGPVSDGAAWRDDYKAFVHADEWFRADYRSIGGVTPGDPETDPTGALVAWLAEAPEDRQPFITETADQRIWDGTLNFEGDPNPGTYFTYDEFIHHVAARGTYHFSYYVFSRFPRGYGINSGDFMPAISPVEMELLEAEALIEQGMPGAAALINQTRVNNGGLSAASDADADLFDKLAYEKRLETYHLNGALAFFDRRGWGTDLGPNDFGQGLMDGTPYHFPVPGAELERLGIPNYTFGGMGAAFDMAGAGIGGAAVAVPATAVYRWEGSSRPSPPTLMEQALRNGPGAIEGIRRR